MSLFTHCGRVEVSSGDSELDSIASSIAGSADELIEELARMALAGHYGGAPSEYETSQLLQGRGMARRPREATHTRLSVGSLLQPTSSSGASSSTPPFYQARARSSTLGGSSLSQVTHGDVDEAENDARALEKMYRRLARQYQRERHSVDCAASATKPAGSGTRVYNVPKADRTFSVLTNAVAPARMTRRELDERIRSRLSGPSESQLARRVEKYERRKEREEEARKQPKRVRVSAEAVKRGTRLFLEAQKRANNVKRIQEKQARQKAAEEKRECTFHPSVSKYAAQLAAGGAYHSLESRLENQAAHDEKRLRLRFERAVELDKECTFKPTLSPGTEELMPILRRRRQRRHLRRSLRTPGGERSRSSRRGCMSSAGHEPFEAGERLYRDGGERLLRQQVRLQRATAKEQRHVVGGGLRLSHADAQQLADRFTAWAAARAANREELRLALEQQMCETGQAAAKREASTRQADGVLRRGSSSNLDGSTSAPRLAKLAGSGWGGSEPAAAGAMAPLPVCTDHFYALPNVSSRGGGAASYPEASREPSNTARAARCPSDADVVARPANALRSLKSSSAPATSPAVDLAVHKELLRIHLGALFYKYAVFPTATAVCLAQVKQQVRCYYPEDFSIVAALASAFANEQQLITKTDFMAALARYVAQYGIQPWCLPHRSVPNAIANVPYGSKTSSDTSTVAAAASNDLVSSSDASEMMNDDAVVTTPSWTGTRTSSGAQGCPIEADCLLVTPTTSRTSKGASEEKPLRTHIYSFPPYPGDSQPTPAPAAVTPSRGQRASMETAPTAALRCAAADKSKETPCDGCPSSVLSKHTRQGKTPAMTAELVRGYEDYVQRQRRAIDRARAASGAGQLKAGEVCAFRPTLTPRSVMLSEKNLEKRMAYARELHQRQRNLHLLHTAVLAEQSGKGSSPGAAGSQGGAEACGTLASTQTPPPTPSTKHSSVSPSGTSPLSRVSPSIEVSSLSCSTPRHESGSAVSKPTATLSPPHQEHVAGNAGMARAIAVLEQLLNDVAGKECSTQAAQSVVRVPLLCRSVQDDVCGATHDVETTAKDVGDVTQTVATGPLSPFLVTKPSQAILSAAEEHLASRHAATTSRNAS
ncbi:hypothetical protein JIQ42_01212 [Leishmania sp. Namibia]|uniref:hypothetical protein n=1 Tax=Leishmania sp. Namibia TaxID=2802991 RepID=UPI001B7AE180|nr:hypothetical protein JIQ42_01212 [Leishmania sp. Namibia]